VKKKILVIGGDSKIGKYLVPFLKKNNYLVISTSRNKKRLNKNKIFLDLSKIDNFTIPNNIDATIFLASITKIKECEDNYKLAYKVNGINTLKLINKLIEKNIFVCFLSSSIVFKNKTNLPKEDDNHQPKSNYAKLKSFVEKNIFKLTKKIKKEKLLCILRVTKNVDTFTEPFNAWIRQINKRSKFSAFKDLYFSPITFHDTTKIILKIVKKKYHGNYHISGERDINYSDFAKKLLKYNNLSHNLLHSCFSYEKNIKLYSNNRITGLDMKKTSKIVKIKPTKIKKILKLFSNKIN